MSERALRTTAEQGRTAEQAARRYLEQQGLTLVTCNFRGRQGEIDLVMSDRDTLVFVEVRYRRASRFGSAADSVSAGKQQRLVATAELFLNRHPRWQSAPCRFDVLAIDGAKRENITWIRDAFRAGT